MSGSVPAGQFAGFPTRGRFTPVHNVFFSLVMPEITDIFELKATLHVFWKLYQKKGYPRFTTLTELLSDISLMRPFQGANVPAEALSKALQGATTRGTLLHLGMESQGRSEDLYFLNTDIDRKSVERIQSGELELPKYDSPPATPAVPPEESNIFSLYESNIGMLTPLIADELKEAERQSPQQWVEEAFREAVTLNKRSWRYVVRILERWANEGKGHGKPERNTEETDPDKYLRGKYGHVVRRR